MTDQHSPEGVEIDDDTPIGIHFEIIPDGTIELHNVAFGHGLPKVLLSMEENEETGGLTFTAIASGFDDFREIIERTRQHLEVLELGLNQIDEEEK